MKANEKNFISLIRRKKEEGILYVIETYSGYLRAIVCRRLYALPDRVDECMNDIFLGIWKNIDSFDASRGSFKNWAGGIARLQAIDCEGPAVSCPLPVWTDWKFRPRTPACLHSSNRSCPRKHRHCCPALHQKTRNCFCGFMQGKKNRTR